MGSVIPSLGTDGSRDAVALPRSVSMGIPVGQQFIPALFPSGKSQCALQHGAQPGLLSPSPLRPAQLAPPELPQAQSTGSCFSVPATLPVGS